jgi:uncharacterized lipoprotein YddW (UPF0748 family)
MAQELRAVNASSPEYLDRLARYVRARTTDLEGLYLSPLTEPAADYTVNVVENVVRRYDVDGIHLDYVRFPADDFDYSRTALDAFRQSLYSDLQPEQQRDLDARMARDPLVYPDAFPERWNAFRQRQLTRLVMRLRRSVKEKNPALTLSAAVVPDAAEASNHRMQDWPGWMTFGLLDIVCPMTYTTDAERFATQVAGVRAMVPRQSVWIGIGAYQLPEDRIVGNVRTARRLDVGGVVLFSYDSLAGTAKGPAYVTAIGRAAFAP